MGEGVGVSIPLSVHLSKSPRGVRASGSFGSVCKWMVKSEGRVRGARVRGVVMGREGIKRGMRRAKLGYNGSERRINDGGEGNERDKGRKREGLEMDERNERDERRMRGTIGR